MEGMMQRLEALESGNRQKRRRFAQHSREFKHAENFDANGILYYLGTARGTEPYVNPTQLGVSCSSGQICYGELTSIVGRVGVDVWVDDDPHEAWYGVDLGAPYRARLTGYTLRRGGGASRARDWVLEGSNDEHEWVGLCLHSDDRNLEAEDDELYYYHIWTYNPRFYSLYRQRTTTTGHTPGSKPTSKTDKPGSVRTSGISGSG